MVTNGTNRAPDHFARVPHLRLRGVDELYGYMEPPYVAGMDLAGVIDPDGIGLEVAAKGALTPRIAELAPAERAAAAHRRLEAGRCPRQARTDLLS